MAATTSDEHMGGVLAPVVTPFGRDLSADKGRFVAFCRALVGLGMGLAPFGTTGEGTSLSVEEKIGLLDALAQGGIPMAKVMAGTAASALPDIIRMAAHATRLGCGGVLMLPPFFFKNVSDDGLYRAYSQIIEGVGDPRLRVYLYHFPKHAQVPLSHGLIGRLAKAYPGIVVGVKDSSGDWRSTEALCQAFPELAVFTGSEALLLKTLRAGGAGCISTNANVNGAAMVELCQNWRQEDADLLQDAIAAFRQAVQDFPVIPAVKALVAMVSGDDTWRITRPPLVDQPHSVDGALRARLAEAGFPVD